jgi:hypothetical protein
MLPGAEQLPMRLWMVLAAYWIAAGAAFGAIQFKWMRARQARSQYIPFPIAQFLCAVLAGPWAALILAAIGWFAVRSLSH